MYLTSLLPLIFLSPLSSASLSPPQQIFANQAPSTFRIPTRHESAIQARRMLHLSSIATLSTVFPSSPSSTSGAPFALMEYYASCPPFPSDPTVLAISIATTFRNAAAGSNVTMSLRYHAPYHHPPADDPYLYLPANLPRFSLMGHMEAILEEEVERWNVSGCFLGKHPEAELWVPGNDIHESWWGRLVVESVFWMGGFGDRAYIGWIPVEEWKGITMEEVEECRLVGEEERGMGKVEIGAEDRDIRDRPDENMGLREQKYWA